MRLVPSPPPHGRTDHYPSYVLPVLLLVCVLSFVDRQIFLIPNDPIGANVEVFDAQTGIVPGAAFAFLLLAARHLAAGEVSRREEASAAAETSC